jgi:hypothetical protein
MTEQSDILVMRDRTGAYYAVPLSELKAYRVPAELEGQASSLLSGDEVSGYGAFDLGGFGLFSASGLQAQDELNSLQLQSLMSRYSQAQALTSNVRKKQDDAAKSIIGNLR